MTENEGEIILDMVSQISQSKEVMLEMETLK